MYINGINVPNEIIDALNNNKLVVFAGAGVSVGAPTCLPNFETLTKKIAEGTNYVLKKGDSCENFLGHLKYKNIDVNKETANIIKKSSENYNKMHESIINLFKNTSDIKIVTTNYDKMFEFVLEKMGKTVTISNAPKLPLGNDINGIVHIHGNVDDTKYMVLTDDDFGVAYLTEGYSTRFLKSLFSSYTVLFIGYSYNDTILRYLTRAIAREKTNTRFIMTDDKESNWEILDIKPIEYKEKDYQGLQKCILELGEQSKRGALEWNNFLKLFKDKPPKDLSLNSQIEYCLSDIDKTGWLADNIQGIEWFEFLNQKGVFNTLFLENENLNEYDEIWATWLLTNIIGTHDDRFIKTYLENNNTVNKEFALKIIIKLIDDKRMDNNIYRDYIIIIKDYIDNFWQINKITRNLLERDMNCLGFEVFKKYFEIEFKIQGNNRCQHRFKMKKNLTQDCLFKETYEKYKDTFVNLFAEQLLEFIKTVLSDLYYGYSLFENEEPYEVIHLIIENRKNESIFEDENLKIICQLFYECTKKLEKNEVFGIENFLIKCLNHPSVLLKKNALKSLRESNVITPCDKFDIFIKNIDINMYGCKEQCFLLIKSIFNNLTEDRKNIFIDEIQNTKKFKNKLNEYIKYNWCVWIKKFCNTNIRINNLEKEILSKYNFEPRKNPELDIMQTESICIQCQSPINKEELYKLSDKDLIDLLNNYEDGLKKVNNELKDFTRDSLLSIFRDCIKENINWTMEKIPLFKKGVFLKEDIWEALFYGICYSKFSTKKLVEIVSIFMENIKDIKNIVGMSRLIFEVIQKKEFKENFAEYSEDFFNYVFSIWELREKSFNNVKNIEDMLNKSVNTTLGNSLLSFVYMLSYQDKENRIPEKYMGIFNKNLNLTDKTEDTIAMFILAGHFNLFYFYDKEWCLKKFKSSLEEPENKYFSIAWSGITNFSYSLNQGLLDDVKGIYLKAIKGIGNLKGNTRKIFIELYVILIIYGIDDPCKEYIPKFYEYANERDIKVFLKKIKKILKDMNSFQKKQFWKEWLKQYIVNRYKNKPIELLEVEKTAFLEYIFILDEIDEIFEEIINLFLSKTAPQNIEFSFLYNLEKKLKDKKKNDELDSKYLTLIIKVLTKLLDDNSELLSKTGASYEIKNIIYLIKDIYENYNLDKDTIKNFKEALLKGNIKFE